MGGGMGSCKGLTMPAEKARTPDDTSVSASCTQKEQKARFLSSPDDRCSSAEATAAAAAAAFGGLVLPLPSSSLCSPPEDEEEDGV